MSGHFRSMSDPHERVFRMEPQNHIYVVRSCAHCGDGCEASERECPDCRLFYCESHCDPDTHDCHLVCIEVAAFEDEELERYEASASSDSASAVSTFRD